MNSGYFSAAGSAGAAFGPQAVTNSSNANADNRSATACGPWDLGPVPYTLRMPIAFRRGCHGQTLDEAARHVSFDDDLAIGGNVADHPRDAVEPRDLLPVEVGRGVKGDGDATRVERHPGGNHLEQLVDALAAA